MFKQSIAEAYQEWLKTHPSIFGSDGEGGGDDGGSAEADDSAGDEVNDDSDDFEADEDHEGDSDDDDDQDGGGDNDADLEQLRRDIADAERARIRAEQAARKAKQEARQERQRKAQESGDLEALRREHDAEIADLNEQLESAREAAAVHEFTLDQERRVNRVQRLASQLNFRDPSDAIALLDDDDTGDDKSAERALRRLAQKKPYLVDRKKGGLPMGGAGGPRLTMQDVKRMSSDEINDRWTEVQEVMARSGANGGG